MVTINGICDARFAGVKDLLESRINADEELGASLVVNINGENVVDIWGGHADAAKTIPWEQNTITNVWSSSKTVVGLAALLLIDRGLLDPSAKVSKYWPEFGVNGKEDVLVRHILGHSSGVPGWQDPITMEEVCDIEPASARLAAQAPWWTPGSASGYHALTVGHLVDALVQRITGKSIKQFVSDELATPLGADFQFGVPKVEYHRVATIIPPPASVPGTAPNPAGDDAAPPSITARTLGNPILDPSTPNQDFWRQGSVPAANGFTNARAMARLLSFVTCGGTVGGKQLLKPETIDLIFQEQTHGADLVLPAEVRYGIGFGLNGVGPDGVGGWLPEGKFCFWGGYGGSMVVCDVERRVTFTYMMNKMYAEMVGEVRTKKYIWEVYKALGVEVPS